MRIVEPSVEIIDELNQDAILRKLELCGRVCYKSEDRITEDSAEKFIRSIIKRGHESVLEHVSFTVRFVTDRAIANELTRHRLVSFSQESTRYVKYNDIEFIMPIEFEKNRLLANYFKMSLYEFEKTYVMLTMGGAKPENARAVLPLCTKTELIMTANIREWRHILKLRLSPAAHPDMRHLMILLFNQLVESLPVLFEDVVS